MFSEYKFSIVLLVDMVTWSLTQCGQRLLPPSMLCSLPCPPCRVWIKYAISVYFCIFNIAHCIDGVHSGMPANPGHGPRVISSTCYVQSGEPVVILWQFYQFLCFWSYLCILAKFCTYNRVLPVNLDQAQDEEERSKPQHYASLLPSIYIWWTYVCICICANFSSFVQMFLVAPHKISRYIYFEGYQSQSKSIWVCNFS